MKLTIGDNKSVTGTAADIADLLLRLSTGRATIPIQTSVPDWYFSNSSGEKILISDMNITHIRNAILRKVRNYSRVAQKSYGTELVEVITELLADKELDGLVNSYEHKIVGNGVSNGLDFLDDDDDIPF